MAVSKSTHGAFHSDGALSAYGTARSTIEGEPLSPDELLKMEAYWRASLYLCTGMLRRRHVPAAVPGIVFCRAAGPFERT